MERIHRPIDVGVSMEDMKVDRADFEAVVKSLLRRPQTSKQEISRKIHKRGRARPLTKPLGAR